MGKDSDGREIFLRDLWPSLQEIRDTMQSALPGYRGRIAHVRQSADEVARREMGRRARAFGMHVIGYDPYVGPARFEELGTPGGILWHLNLGWAAAATGDLGRCFAALAAGARQAERFGSRRWRRSIELQRVAERYWTGRWPEVVAVVDDNV